MCSVGGEDGCERPLKAEANAVDVLSEAHTVPGAAGRKETIMTPIVELPPEYQTVTAASPGVVEVVYFRPEADEDALVEPLGPSDFPEGIDYDRWVHVVRPSPREAFADPLDFPDLFDD
jgi:hypothetical protein